MATTFSGEAAIEALYVGYFGRAGDPAGVSYWVGQLNNGLSITQIAASFSVQTESKGLYSFLNNPNVGGAAAVSSFIDAVYNDLFNHPADAAGKAYWTAQLQAANGNPQAIGQFILNVITGSQGSDATAIQNKVAVAQYFTDQLAINNDAYNASANTTAHTVVGSTTSDPATVTTNEAAVDTYVKTAGSANVGQTFILTTGVDLITGTNANDTFIADNSGANPTYTAADSIAGGGGTDTFKLFSNAGTSYNLSNVSQVANGFVSNLGGGQTVNAASSSGMTSLQLDNTFGGAGGVATAVVNGQKIVLSNDSSNAANTYRVTSATDTSENITVQSTVTNANANETIDVNGTTITSATLNLSGQKAFILDNSGTGGAASKLATVTVLGSGGSLVATVNDVSIAKVDASGSTAGVSFDESAVVTVPVGFSYTGAAAGNNKLVMTQAQIDSLTSGSQLNGGNTTGVNTLVDKSATGVFAATDYAHINAATNFQVLGFDTIAGATTVDASKLTAITQFSETGTSAGITFNNVASGDIFTLASSSAAAATTINAAVGSTETINFGLATTTAALSDAVTLTNVTTANLTSNGTSTSSELVTFTNAGSTSYVVGASGAANLDIASDGATTAKSIDASAFTAKFTLGTDGAAAFFGQPATGDAVTAGTSGAGDLVKTGTGASLLIESKSDVNATNGADSFVLKAGHAAADIVSAGPVTTVFFGATTQLETVSNYALGQDILTEAFGGTVRAGVIATNGADIGGGVTLTGKGLVNAGIGSATTFLNDLKTGTPGTAYEVAVYTDGTDTYVAEANGTAAGDWHVVKLAGVVATQGLTLTNGHFTVA